MRKIQPNKKQKTIKRVSNRGIKSLENIINTRKIVNEKPQIATKPKIAIKPKIDTKPKIVNKNYDEYKKKKTLKKVI